MIGNDDNHSKKHVDWKPVVVWAVLIFVLAGFQASASAQDAGENNRPNILMIVSEDHGPNLGVYGDPFAQTPRIDRLAQQGVVFERAYITQAGCSPSRSTLFTGLYPHQNGQIGLATHGLRLYDSSIFNMPRALKQAGYRTGIVGKIHVNPESAFAFDEEIKGDKFKNRDVRKVADNAKRFMSETSGEQPFFLQVNFADVHRPYTDEHARQVDGLPAKPYEKGDVDILPFIGIQEDLQAEKVSNYYNSIERLDTGIGMVLDELVKTGKKDNTIILFLSDHGADLFRGKRTPYEGGLRIPWVMRWDQQIPAGQRVNELVSTIDLVPTLSEAAGISYPDNLPGQSLLPLLKGEQTDWRQYLFAEYHLHSPHNLYPQRTVRDDKYKLILNLHHGQFNPGYAFTVDRIYDSRSTVDSALARAPITVQRAYDIYRKAPEYELYDLVNDPHEFNNLAYNESYKPILERLKSALQQWRVETRDPLLSKENLELLERDVYNVYENGDYLLRNEQGQLELGNYHRVRRSDDYWPFYETWTRYINNQ